MSGSAGASPYQVGRGTCLEIGKFVVVHLVHLLSKALLKCVDIMNCLTEPNVREEHFRDFCPDEKAATKGGSLAAIFPVQFGVETRHEMSEFSAQLTRKATKFINSEGSLNFSN